MMCVWRLDRGIWHGTGDKIGCFYRIWSWGFNGALHDIPNTQDNEMIKENSLIPRTLSLMLLSRSIFDLNDEVIFSIAVLHLQVDAYWALFK
jgi:hypothetical protein